MLSFGRIIRLIILGLVVAGLIYSGVWHYVTLFIWQNPMLTWVPLLVFFGVGLLVGAAFAAIRSGQPEGGRRFSFGWGFLAGLAVLPDRRLVHVDLEAGARASTTSTTRSSTSFPPAPSRGFSPAPGSPTTRASATPPRSTSFAIRRRGELLWTGEWHGSWLGGPSDGIAVRSLDELVAPAEIVQGGFVHSVGGINTSTVRGKAQLKHPFSKIQYPVVVPTAEREAIAVAPYAGYRGFPFKYPYAKGVLVYHQDGELEDLTPEEAAARPELAATGRLFPESVARSQAEALSRTDEFEGDIHDGDGNKQPYLTAIDPDHTDWVTIIDSKDRTGVTAVVLADSTTGETEVWQPSPGRELISSEEALNQARAMPLRWEEERCCDSEGDSYTVTLREVQEARLAFKDGKAVLPRLGRPDRRSRALARDRVHTDHRRPHRRADREDRPRQRRRQRRHRAATLLPLTIDERGRPPLQPPRATTRPRSTRATQRLFRATIDWFEAKGKKRLIDRDQLRRVVRGLHRVPRRASARSRLC